MRELKALLAALVLLVGISACSNQTVEITQTQSFGLLTPWVTETLAPSQTPTLEGMPTATFAPTLTPTPGEYTVKANDTLIVIAYRNGLTVAELLAANPDVNPYTMSIGTLLKIPAAKPGSGTASAPTPNPAPVSLGEPFCQASLTGGSHCFALVTNESDVALENMSAEFQLLNEKGESQMTQDAALPLALLLPGETQPLYTYFDTVSLDEWEIHLQLLSAYRVSPTGSNNFRLSVSDLEVQIAEDGYSAKVAGRAISSEGDPAAKSIRIIAIAYDDGGTVIGLRTYQEIGPLESGAEFDFNLLVYSTGHPISSVQVYAEAAR